MSSWKWNVTCTTTKRMVTNSPVWKDKERSAMNESSQRFASAAVDSLGWTRPATVVSEHVQDWFGGAAQRAREQEFRVRLEERGQERRRIAQELHDTLFQGFVGASMILHRAVDELPADSPSKNSLSQALRLIYQVMDEGRNVLDGLRSRVDPPANLEKAFVAMRDDFTPDGPQLQISVMGRPTALNPAVQEQVCLIGREALVNALRHSGATMIEAEIEYLPTKVRVVVRDNGSGIDPGRLESGRNSHWGLAGMRERAKNIGAQLQMWSRNGAGTEVELSLPTTSPDWA
jgi:signal transduction histidine kinase